MLSTSAKTSSKSSLKLKLRQQRFQKLSRSTLYATSCRCIPSGQLHVISILSRSITRTSSQCYCSRRNRGKKMIEERRSTISTLLMRRMKKMTMMSLRLSRIRNEDKRRHRRLLRSNQRLIHASPHLIHQRSKSLRCNKRTSRRRKNLTKNKARTHHLLLPNLQLTPNLHQKRQNSHQPPMTLVKQSRQNQSKVNSQLLQLQKRRMVIRKRM